MRISHGNDYHRTGPTGDAPIPTAPLPRRLILGIALLIAILAGLIFHPAISVWASTTLGGVR